jgi:hypothetical protein
MKRILLILVLLAIGILLPTAAFAQGPSGSYASGIACLNLSQDNTLATITFYNQQGGTVTTVSNPALEPNKPWLLFTPSISGLGSGFLGSAVVGSGAEVACSVNTQTTGGTQRVGTAEGVATANTGAKLYATQVLNNAGGFSSYVAIQNAGDAAADVRVTYYNLQGQQAIAPQTVNIPAKSSKVFYQDQAGLAAGFNGSATFEAVNGTTPLAGAVALYSTGGAQLLSFNTFKDGANKVYLPRVAKNLSGQGYTGGWACQNLGPDPADMTMNVTMLNQATSTTVNAQLTKNGVAVGQSWLGYFWQHPWQCRFGRHSAWIWQCCRDFDGRQNCLHGQRRQPHGRRHTAKPDWPGCDLRWCAGWWAEHEDLLPADRSVGCKQFPRRLPNCEHYWHSDDLHLYLLEW